MVNEFSIFLFFYFSIFLFFYFSIFLFFYFLLESEFLTIYSDRRVWQADSLTNIVEKLLRLKISMPQSESIIPDFINFIEQLSNVDSPDYFIELCRETLDIEAELIGFENALIEAKRDLGISFDESLDDAPDMTFTSRGMLITKYDITNNIDFW